MGAFDDLVPGGQVQSSGTFDDLLPGKKGSYFSGDQGLVPDVFEDIGKGIYSGVVSVPQGIAELGALFLDYALDTNTSRTVTEAFEAIKPEDMGTAGEVTEDLVAFGVGFIPIAGWLGRAGQAAKLAKVGKPMSTAGRGKFTKSAIDFGTSKTGQKALGTWGGLTGATAGATAAYSTAVANDGRATLSDNFEILPDILKTEEDIELSGRDEAKRRLRNKLRVGTEDAILSGVFDTALKGAAMGSRAIGQTDTAAAAARAIRSAPEKVAGSFMKGLDALDRNTIGIDAAPKLAKGMKAANQQFKKYFTASGGADTRLYETVQDARAKADMYEKIGLQAAEDWDKAAKAFVKAAKLGKDKTPVDAEILKKDLGQFLIGNREALEAYGDEALVRHADKMVEVRASLDDNIIVQLEEAIGYKLDPDTGRRMADIKTGRYELQDPTTPAQIKAAKALKEMQNAQAKQTGYLRRLFEQYTNPVQFYKNIDLTSKEFDDAVNEVGQHLVVGKGRAPNANDMAQAKRIVYDSLGLQGMGGLPPEQALNNLRQSIIDKEKGKGFGLVARERPVLKSIDDIFVERKEILDISPSLRKLKGELTDPLEVYKRTVNDMAQANAAADMYAGMRPQGLVADLIPALDSLSKGGRPAIVDIPDRLNMSPEAYNEAMQPFREIARDQNIGVERSIMNDAGEMVDNPNYIKPETVVESYKNQLRDAGYVQLGDSTDIQHVFGGSYGNLTGMMVSPESYGALTAPLKLGSGALGEITGILSAMRSLSQKMTIVPNPGAQVRNIVGNMGMLAGNANLGRDTDFTDMFKIFTSSLDTLSDAGLEQLAKKISLTGVADTSLVTRALKEYRKAGRDLTISGKLTNAIDMFESNIPFMKLFERIYSESDTFFKGLALLGEEKKLLNAFKAARVSEDNPYVLQALKDNGLVKRDAGATRLTEGLSNTEVMAGDIVKDTMPIYPRVGKAVRAIDMVPIFGNFTSFASENIRNSVNILDRGLKEMSFEVSPAIREKLGDQVADQLQRQFRAMGAQRLMSYMAVASTIPKSMVRGSMIATGTTEEQMEALREQLPEYMAGHDVVILNNNQKGKLDYIDLSYISPYAFVLDPVRAAIEKYTQAGKLDKSEAEQIAAGAFKGLEMFLEPFGSESMIFERLRDVLPSEGLTGLGVGRGGKTATGATVYSDTESRGDQIGKGVAHILNGIIPEYVRLAGEFENVRTGEFEPGRVYRAATGLPGKRGEEYNVFKEGARLVTGFTPMTVDLQNDFAFKGLEYGPRRTDAKTTATRVIKRADATIEEMNTAWGNYLDNLYREQSKLYADIQSARELGLSDFDIRRNLVQGANMSRSEVNAIMDGRFYPTAASRELAKDINAMRKSEGRSFVEGRVPFTSFNRMTSSRINEPLARSQPSAEKLRAPAPTQTAPTGVFDDLIPSSPAPAAPAPTGVFDDLLPQREGSLPVAPAPVQTASAMVDPILLGTDPATQALAKSLGRSQ